MAESVLPFSLYNGGTGTSSLLKLKNQIPKTCLIFVDYFFKICYCTAEDFTSKQMY